MFTFLILQGDGRDGEYTDVLEYIGYVPRIVIDLAKSFKWCLNADGSNREQVVQRFKEKMIGKLSRMLSDEEKLLNPEEFKRAARQLSIICTGQLVLADECWVETDISWSCLKSITVNCSCEGVHMVTAISSLAQDAVNSYLDKSFVGFKEVVSMDSLTLANNSASQKARYVP